MTTSQTGPRKATTEEPVIHILWINAGLSCDGDSVALTAAMQPTIEDIVLGALPGLPKVSVHWPLIDYGSGPLQGADPFIEWFYMADRDELDPFVLVVEGSIPNEAIKTEGYWCGLGNNPETGRPMTTSEWLDRLAPAPEISGVEGDVERTGPLLQIGPRPPGPVRGTAGR